MLSRVADGLYWMSRYLERAAHTAQLLDVNFNLMLDQGHDATSEARWTRLLLALRVPPPTPVEGANGAAPEELDGPRVTRMLTFEPNSSYSISSCVFNARENARQVREEISSEMWEQLNRLYLRLRQGNLSESWLDQPHEFFQEIEEGVRLFQGITDDSMSHGEGWHFIQVGRAIERAGAIASLLDVHFGQLKGKWQHPNEEAGYGQYVEWIALLRSCQAFEAYVRVYTADVRPARIAEFLLLDEAFPRSVRFSIDRLQVALDGISNLTEARSVGNVSRMTGRLQATLSFGQIDEIMAEGLHAYLNNIQKSCRDLHAALHQIYINYPIQSALV